jgi:hypothetical protein
MGGKTMTETTKLYSAHVEEMFWLDDGETSADGLWTKVCEEAGDYGPWYQIMTLVIHRTADNSFWGVDWDRGLTESQDHCYPWRDADTVTATRLWPKPHLVRVWLTEKPEDWGEE